MGYKVENIIENMMDKGLPESLAGEVEQIIVKERSNADYWKNKYKELETLRSWDNNPDMMGK